MRGKIFLACFITGMLCVVTAVTSFANDAPVVKYYVGKVVGLDAIKKAMTISEYNSNDLMQFVFTRTGLPYDVSLGDEVVVGADSKHEVREIRFLEGGERLPSTANVYDGRDWNPFEDIAVLQEQMSRVFQDSLRSGSMDQGLFNSNLSFDKDFKLEDKGNEYVIKLDLTGLDKDKVEIEINKNSITLKGQSEIQKQENSRNGTVQYHSFGTFLKTIPLPPDADTRSMSSNLEGETMTVIVPKK